MRIGTALAACGLALALTSPAAAGCVVYSFASMPVAVSADGVKASALVNDHPVEFTVNNTASYSMMHKNMATSANMQTQPLSASFRAYSDKGGLVTAFGYGDTLKFGKQTLRGPRFIVISGANAPDVAILGPNILNLRDAEYNLAAGTIRLSRPEGCTGQDMAYWAQPDQVRALPLEAFEGQLNRRTIGKVMVNGTPMRAMFSTRHRWTTLSAAAARSLGGSPFNEGGRDRIKVATLDIGGELGNDVTLDVAPDDLSEDVDLMVGLDFFLTHRIYVSNGRRTLFFTASGTPAATASTAP